MIITVIKDSDWYCKAFIWSAVIRFLFRSAANSGLQYRKIGDQLQDGWSHWFNLQFCVLSSHRLTIHVLGNNWVTKAKKKKFPRDIRYFMAMRVQMLFSIILLQFEWAKPSRLATTYKGERVEYGALGYVELYPKHTLSTIPKQREVASSHSYTLLELVQCDDGCPVSSLSYYLRTSTHSVNMGKVAPTLIEPALTSTSLRALGRSSICQTLYFVHNTSRYQECRRRVALSGQQTKLM